MVADSSATQQGDSLIAAKDRMETGPVPGWVTASSFSVESCTGQGEAISHLLIDQQIQAELGQRFFHSALRLNTMEGVLGHTPWRLDFERRQKIILHWIKIWRTDAPPSLADLSSARIADRPGSGLAHHDRQTLLLMLEDVRPGDILEWCYTIENRPSLLPDRCAAIFTLPMGVVVGKFNFSLHFNTERPMRWKSGVAEWVPVENCDANGNTNWVWRADNYTSHRAEENRPAWHIPYPWIQVSDCANWGIIAAAYAKAWGPLAAGLAETESATGDPDIMQKVEKIIDTVRDDYRYLAADGELDGQPPAAPEVVMRRRYGDGKDLSFLLAHLLEGLGLPARLILVNTIFGKSIGQFLPDPALFNHILVEFTVLGQCRWVDATLRRQSGIRDYGAGLPIAGPSSDLVEIPPASVKPNVYQLKESILLDTAGGWSWLGVVIAARGIPAEALREELERDGLEGMAKNRLRHYTERFTEARRIGALEVRDDPAADEFFLAEVFEIKGFLALDPKTKWFKLELPNDYIAKFLDVTAGDIRRAPFALLYPCQIVHTIELHSVALTPAMVQQRTVASDLLHFTRVRKTLAGNWTMTLTLSTGADCVPPETLGEHRKTVQKIRAQSNWSMLVPAGDTRSRRRGDFAALPKVVESIAPPVSFRRAVALQKPPVNSVPVAARPETANVPEAAISIPPKAEIPPQKWRKRGRRKERGKKTYIALTCLGALILIVIVFLAAKNADRWHIFKTRPVPPTPAIPIQ